MRATVVIDASVALSWHFADEADKSTEQLNSLADHAGLLVPRHWWLEVANGLHVGVWRARTSEDDSDRFMQFLQAIDVTVDSAELDHVFRSIILLARKYRLTIYDAAYLELAQREQLPIATLDNALIKASRASGVSIVPSIR